MPRKAAAFLALSAMKFLKIVTKLPTAVARCWLALLQMEEFPGKSSKFGIYHHRCLKCVRHVGGGGGGGGGDSRTTKHRVSSK